MNLRNNIRMQVNINMYDEYKKVNCMVLEYNLRKQKGVEWNLNLRKVFIILGICIWKY